MHWETAGQIKAIHAHRVSALVSEQPQLRPGSRLRTRVGRRLIALGERLVARPRERSRALGAGA